MSLGLLPPLLMHEETLPAQPQGPCPASLVRKSSLAQRAGTVMCGRFGMGSILRVSSRQPHVRGQNRSKNASRSGQVCFHALYMSTVISTVCGCTGAELCAVTGRGF
jgi:hypothetical protein